MDTQMLAYVILTVGLTLGLGPRQDMEFTFLLPARSTECFYQTTARNDSMEFEYQVNVIFSLSLLSVLHSDSVMLCFEVLNSFIKVSEACPTEKKQVSKLWTLVLHSER